MAGEVFAGVQLTAQPGKKTYARGGGIPIGDIPNAPRPDVSMPIAEAPGIPSIRYQEMQLPDNWNQRAARLQQDELPGSFAQASQRVAAAAGTGQMAMGQAISSGSWHVSSALGEVASVLGKLQKEAIESRDETDLLRSSKNREIVMAKLEADTATMTPQERTEYYKAHLQEELSKVNGNLGYRSLTKDKIAAADSALVLTSQYKLQADAAKQSLDDDIKFTAAEYNAAVDKGDVAKASELSGHLYSINKDKAGLVARNSQVEALSNKEVYRTALSLNPEEVEKTADASLHGQEIKGELSFLGQDKVMAAQALNEARAAKTQKWQDATTSLENDIADGKVKTDAIMEEGKKRGVPSARLASIYKTATSGDPAPNPELTSSLTTRIAKYDPLSMPGEMSNMKEYTDLKNEIDKLPKVQREELNSQVEKKWERAKEGIFPKVTEKQVGETMGWVDEMSKRQVFGTYKDQGLDSDGKVPKGKDPEAAARATVYHNKIQAIKEEIQQFVHDNPEASASKIQETAEDIARKAAGKADLPDPPRVSETEAKAQKAHVPTVQEILDERLRRMPGATPTHLPGSSESGSKQIGGGYVIPANDESPKLKPVHVSMRNEIMSELDRSPQTKRLAMQMLDTEGGGVATMEALVNRVAMIRQKVPGWTIWDELNSGFYGPINRGYAQTLSLHPSSIARYERDIAAVRAGSNVIKGRTDQGYPGDPNYNGPGRVRVASNPKESYNYWIGRRRGVDFSHADSAAFANQLEG